MAQLIIRLNGYSYTVACEDGQEAHLQAMAHEVERWIDSIKALGTQTGEGRMLVLAALLMADQIDTLRERVEELEGGLPSTGGGTTRHMAQTFARLAERAERIASAMEQS